MSKLIPVDSTEFLKDRNEQLMLLNEAFADGDPSVIMRAFALITLAENKNRPQMAEECSVSRSALHKALSSEGNPTLSTLIGIIKSLGIKPTFELA